MRNKISRYEENQVDRFLYDLYLLWGGNLDEDMCIGEGWIVYLEGREKYQYDIGDAEYWEYVRTNVKKLFLDLRKIRNNRIRIESRLSLNQRFGEEKEEIGAIFPGKTGDFANYVALWDYAERLGSINGVTNGIKYITSKPGLDQQLKVEHIELQPETKKELNERFCLIYTGQRRLARNLLRDVVGRYVGNEPDSLYALNEIQKVAALMRFELERGKIDEFASLLNYHWELSRKVDAGSTNTLIDQIFLSIEDLIDAKMVCGAGGGGFLQVILKKGVQKTDVHKRLKDVFQDNPVDVWNCEIM